MRINRFLSIFSLLLAFVLFFPGCDSGSTPPDKPGTPGTSYNGMVFVRKVGTNSYAYVSIYTTSSRLITPKTGDSYATAVVSFNADGDSNYNNDPKSKGTITIQNGSLVFTPGQGYSGSPCSGVLTGSGSATTLSMNQIPGTSYSGEMELSRTSVIATGENPFGPNDFINPDDNSPVSPTNPTSPVNPNAPPIAVGGNYVPGKIVTNFIITEYPKWGPEPSIGNLSINGVPGKTDNAAYRRMYFEGDPFNLAGTGIQVRVTYNDGTWEDLLTESQVAAAFAVEPPEFRRTVQKGSATVGVSSLNTGFNYIGNLSTNGGQVDYTLYYKEGFGNSSVLARSGTLPDTTWRLSATFKGPFDGNIYPIREINYVGNTSLDEWLEDEDRVFPPERTDVSVKVKWWGNGNASIADGNYSFTVEGRLINYHNRGETNIPLTDQSPTEIKLSDRKYQLLLPASGRETATTENPIYLNVAIGNWSVPFAVKAYRKVEKIEKSNPPSFSEQIIFDDPRLYGNGTGTTPLEKSLHWLNKLQGGSIKVSYTGTTKTRTRSMLDAFNTFNTMGLNFIRYNAGPFTTAKGAIGLYYYGKEIVGYEVPVFTNLVGITIKTKLANNSTPILYSSVPDNERTFLKNMVTVNAIYEAGKGGTTISRTDTFGEIFGKNENGKNISCVGVFDSTIDANLTKATTNYLKKPPELTTVRVGFTTGAVRKYTDFQIGAVGY